MRRVSSILTMILILFILLVNGVGGAATNMLNNDWIKEQTPYDYNVVAAGALGLADGAQFTDEYFALQAYYADLLIQYIDAKLDLTGLDRELAESEMRFIPRTKRQDVYQTNYANGWSYLYLRSNVLIERLDADELEKLKAYCAEECALDHEGVEAFVEATWLNVTKAAVDYPDDAVILFEPDGKSAVNLGLVIGLATSPEYDADGMFVDAEHEPEKEGYLRLAGTELEAQLTEALGAPVAIFLYF